MVVLTIVGFSINDTIIIFDRIRENLQKYGEEQDLALICNVSLSQTLVRSLNTTVTILLSIVALMPMATRYVIEVTHGKGIVVYVAAVLATKGNLTSPMLPVSALISNGLM